MPNVSFSLTTPQIRDKTKTVTRRLGWMDVKFNVRYFAVEKAQGLKKGEHVKVICAIYFRSSRWESLQRLIDDPVYGAEEMIKEGFPGRDPAEFVELMCRKYKCASTHPFNRLEFRYYE